jgi:uncharacterized protein
MNMSPQYSAPVSAPVSPPILIPTIGSANKRKAKPSHIVIATLLTIVFLLLSSVLLLHAYIAWTLARPPVLALTSNPLMAIGLPYHDVEFPSANGRTKLNGWYIPAERPSETTVVFSHGYGGNREETWVPIYELAKASHLQGYNVLMFDYGFNRPDLVVTGGVQEKEELLGAIDFAKRRGALRTIVWGFSMGAGTALQAALQTSDIDAMILDSTFILNPDTLYHNLQQHIHLPRFPSVPLIRLFFPILNGTSLKQIPYQTVSDVDFNLPIFFIHGKEDALAPYELAQRMHRNQQQHAITELWMTPRDIHEMVYRGQKQEYLQRVFGFLNKALADPQPSTFAQK